MIDLDNNTRLILFTMVLQQAGHVPTGFYVETAATPPRIVVSCSRCAKLMKVQAYRGAPGMNLDLVPIAVVGDDEPPRGPVPACVPIVAASPRVSSDAIDAFVSHVAELTCVAPCEPGDPCIHCWARSLTAGLTAGLPPLSLDFINAWRTLHGKPRVKSVEDHVAESARP